MSPQEERRHAARLAKYARYNASSKGQARRKIYEDAHPERATQWGVLMHIRARKL